MAKRRPMRLDHVRPRLASTGRPAPERARPRLGPPPDLVGRRPLRAGRRLPLPARLVLLTGIAILGIVVLVAGSGALGRIVAAVGGSLSGLSLAGTPTAAPSPTLIPLLDAPAL